MVPKRLFSILFAAGILVGASGCDAFAHQNNGAEQTGYDNNTNYMAVMIQAAFDGDMETLQEAAAARSAKITAENLEVAHVLAESLLENYEDYAGFSLTDNYLQTMQECCLSGDVSAGREAESKRNNKIDTLHLDIPKISYDDMNDLSKILTLEAGSSWLSMEWKMMVGEVVMNRVASPEFPNSISDVIHAPGQYPSANKEFFKTIKPFDTCVEAATRLLNGERLLNDPSVVFQSKAKQGSGVARVLKDKVYGNTHLCYSNHPELYV